MSTAQVGDEELTIALEFSVFKSNMVIVIIAVEGKIKSVKSESIAFLGVALGFLSLANHSRIHRSFSFQDNVLDHSELLSAITQFMHIGPDRI